ncbi:hypothetical protein [Flavobacterium muglaense]|uniref:Uncharacterized protein n=1 Tax=Flavobacterium muglaense TaxID=2764716 RepID=A0A923MVZ9_9FLAO|nr:hypothetical protein [Flavobacterium muglaense]MBC5836777.1 hypothetical protein [Flavobacterium muglaense]MBC5843273.1 hypothetical protein [Flavobacterium muglaense]
MRQLFQLHKVFQNKKQHKKILTQKPITIKQYQQLKMNRYQLLKKNKNTIHRFVKNGILSYMVIRDIEIYEALQQLQKDIPKELKYIMLAEQFELSPDRVKQIIYNMQSLIT